MNARYLLDTDWIIQYLHGRPEVWRKSPNSFRSPRSTVPSGTPASMSRKLSTWKQDRPAAGRSLTRTSEGSLIALSDVLLLPVGLRRSSVSLISLVSLVPFLLLGSPPSLPLRHRLRLARTGGACRLPPKGATPPPPLWYTRPGGRGVAIAGQARYPGPPWLTLPPLALAPGRGIRIIPGRTWWHLVFWPWRLFVAARAAAVTAPLPALAPLGSAGGVYFTDQESVQGLLSPADYARRVSLAAPTQFQCQMYGCAVVEFGLPAPAAVTIPTPYPSISPGLTPGGAREWRTVGNVSLADTMLVAYVDVTASGPRYFMLPL